MANFLTNLLGSKLTPGSKFQTKPAPSPVVGPSVTPKPQSITSSPSSTSPVSTSPASVKTPAAQQYIKNQTSSSTMPYNVPSTNNPVTSVGSLPNAPKSAYLDYLRSQFNVDNLNKLQTQRDQANKSLADITSEEDTKAVGARREQQRILDEAGGTTQGAQQSANMASRRSNAELADIAVRKNAAANIAKTYSDAYDSAIGAGKSVYEAETAAAKAAQEQSNFEKEYALKVRELNIKAAKDKADGLLSIQEAKALGVPYGTTKAQAIGKRSLSPTQLEAQTNANSALLSLNNLVGDIKNPDGTYKNSKLLNFGFGKTAQAQRELRDVITRIRTGAAINKSEEAFYKSLIPRPIDDAATIDRKVNQLSAFYAGIAGSPVSVQLPDGSILVADDMYDPATRTALRQAIQDGGNVVEY